MNKMINICSDFSLTSTYFRILYSVQCFGSVFSLSNLDKNTNNNERGFYGKRQGK